MKMRTMQAGGWLVVSLLASLGLEAAGRDVPLVDAAKKSGNLPALRTLLRQGIDVNTPEADGSTALHWAAHREDVAAVALLIEAGANVKAATRYGVTPLSLASENGNAGIIERLLKAGADPNGALPSGETVLMTAARTGKPAAVKLLLAHGANVNASENTRGQTALMWAAAQNNAAAIAVLIEGGADIHARSRGPVMPAKAQAAGARVGGAARNYRAAQRLDAFTPLLFAVRAGHSDAVKALLKAGANINDTAEDGTSALVVAAMNAHWELGALLLESGADPNADRQGWTALHQVARMRGLSFGRTPYPVPSGTMSPLEFARRLIARGADVNARVKKRLETTALERAPFVQIGATPLLLAAKGFDAEMMRLLAASGADPRLTTSLKSTALMLAAGCEVAYPGQDSGSPEDALEAVKVALELGGDPNAINDMGETALHGAAFAGLDDVIRLLVDKGARLDIRNKNDMTPLAVAHMEMRAAFLQSQPRTAALLRRMMEERGLPTEVKSAEYFVLRDRANATKGRAARDPEEVAPADTDAGKPSERPSER